MQQKNVKQFQNIKPKLAVCPVRSQMRINRECFFDPNFPKNGFWGPNSNSDFPAKQKL